MEHKPYHLADLLGSVPPIRTRLLVLSPAGSDGGVCRVVAAPNTEEEVVVILGSSGRG